MLYKWQYWLKALNCQEKFESSMALEGSIEKRDREYRDSERQKKQNSSVDKGQTRVEIR